MQKLFTTISLSIGLLTGLASAQTYLTGQAARAVLGQQTFTSNISGGVSILAACAPGQTTNCTPTTSTTPPGVQTPASDIVFGAMGGLGYAAGTLFVADSNRLGILPTNNRVLMFNNVGQQFLGYGPFDDIPPYTARCVFCGGQANVILGQPDISTVAAPNPPTSASMRLALGVASDGQHVAVADTANNRILLWNSMPTSTGQPADLVLGQPNFTSFLSGSPTASSMRGPQGVWFQNGMFFVADTGNNRILIWNSVPTANNQPANLVLGQPNFTSGGQYDLVNSSLTVAASIMASPTSVTSDGTHLFVSDLGFSRVLIWNSIPTTNQQPADVEVGQIDMAHSIANDSSELCQAVPGQTDSNGNPVYPTTCLTTLNFPRFALADDRGRLYIADGGNDRVMVYNTIPAANAAAANAVLGEPDEFSDVVSSSQSILATGFPLVTSSSNVTPTPTSLAWDGTNLYVADPTDYRILVFTPGQPNVSTTGIVNSASQAIFAQATITIGGTIQENDTVTVTIGANSTATTVDYTYKILSTDTLDSVAQAVASAINNSNSGAGDPNVLAYDQIGLATIVVFARQSGPNGNNITLATTTAPTSSVKITATASGATLAGGGAAGQAAPGTLISINGTNLSDVTASAPGGVGATNLPFSLGGVEVYSDGNRMPLLMVSPTQINTEIPWEVAGSNSTSVYVRTQHADGSVTVTNAIGVPLLDSGAPGIFATVGTNEPRVGQVFHASSFASGIVTVSDPAATTTTNGVTTTATQAGDTGTITIGDRPYSYTTVATDTPLTIANNFVTLINSDPEATVTAAVSPVGAGIVVTAKVPGPLGNGISLGGTSTTLSTNTGGALLTLSASGALCCANVANRLVTALNPATPGETIYFLGTGLGLICTSTFLDASNATSNCNTGDPAKAALITGTAYNYTGTPAGAPLTAINATIAGGSATVISASVVPGTNGLYVIEIKLPTTLTANPFTQLFIQQQFNASNIVTLPVGNPLNF